MDNRKGSRKSKDHCSGIATPLTAVAELQKHSSPIRGPVSGLPEGGHQHDNSHYLIPAAVISGKKIEARLSKTH